MCNITCNSKYLCVFPEHPVHHYSPVPIPNFPAWNRAVSVAPGGVNSGVEDGQGQRGLVVKVACERGFALMLNKCANAAPAKMALVQR